MMLKFYIQPYIVNCLIIIQANVKGYLLRKTEKGRLYLAKRCYPYVYYYLKYGKWKKNGEDNYKLKLLKFNHIVDKLKEKN